MAVWLCMHRVKRTNTQRTQIPNSLCCCHRCFFIDKFFFCQFCVCVVFRSRAKFHFILFSHFNVRHTKCKLAHKAHTQIPFPHTRGRTTFQPSVTCYFPIFAFTFTYVYDITLYGIRGKQRVLFVRARTIKMCSKNVCEWYIWLGICVRWVKWNKECLHKRKYCK